MSIRPGRFIPTSTPLVNILEDGFPYSGVWTKDLYSFAGWRFDALSLQFVKKKLNMSIMGSFATLKSLDTCHYMDDIEH